MIQLFHSFSWLFIIVTFLPLVNHPHWFFRVFDFGKIQLFIFQALLLVLSVCFITFSGTLLLTQISLAISICYIATILYTYTPLYKVKNAEFSDKSSKPITIISTNVYQFNKEYQRFVDFIKKNQPDIFITMESNQAWDDAMKVLEADYPYFHKIPLENTYGMHFYSKLKAKKITPYFFVADDIPSIEADLVSEDNFRFTVFALHPPPPSPTEEETSKERDGELLSIAKKIRNSPKQTFIAVGDFNTVAWGRSSRLFRKTSEMIDPRMGRGFISTFHAKYRLLRFPIDQIFHTPNVFVDELKALENVGSDHLPIYCRFVINHFDDSQEELVKTLEEGVMKKVNEIIQDGIEEQSDREKVVTE